MEKKSPKALDYIVLHHVSLAYLRSVRNIAEGNRDELIKEVHEEAIIFLKHFIETHQVSERGLSTETKNVLRVIKMSVKGIPKSSNESIGSLVIH